MNVDGLPFINIYKSMISMAMFHIFHGYVNLLAGTSPQPSIQHHGAAQHEFSEGLWRLELLDAFGGPKSWANQPIGNMEYIEIYVVVNIW
jgi:hypothetical protein